MSDTNAIHSANHNSQILDWDPCFKIDPISRAITTDAKKLSIMQYDHNSERFTFAMGRKVEGHDMTACIVRIHYTNIGNSRSTSSNIYPVTDITPCTFNEETGEYTTDENGNMVCFTWLVPGLATRYAGTLNFIVEFTCKDTDKNSDTYDQVIYRWNTNIFKSIYINTSLNHDDEVAVLYSDLLEEWERKFQSYYEDMDAAVEAGKEDLRTSIDAATVEFDNALAEHINTTKEYVDSVAENTIQEFDNSIDSVAVDTIGIIKGMGPPTSDTVTVTPTVGMLYRDILNGDLYQYTRVSGSDYSWKKFSKAGLSASEIYYNNTNSGLSASDVQTAIDLLVAGVGTGSGSYITDISLSVEDGSSGSGGEPVDPDPPVDPTEPTTYNITVTTNNASYSGSSVIESDNVATITFTPNTGYELSVSNITVTNADYSFNTYTGVLTLSNPTSDVTIELTAVTATTVYSITVNNKNCTYSGPSSIYKNGTATITFTPNDGYTYSGATNVINASWGLNENGITLYNPKGNITVNLVCSTEVVTEPEDPTVIVKVYYGESSPDVYQDIVSGTTLEALASNYPDNFEAADYNGTNSIRYIMSGLADSNRLFYLDENDNTYKIVGADTELIADTSSGTETIYEFYVAVQMYLYDNTTNTQYTYFYIPGQTFGQWLDVKFENDSPSKDGSSVTGQNNYIIMYAEGLYITRYSEEGNPDSEIIYISSDTSIENNISYYLTDIHPSDQA